MAKRCRKCYVAVVTSIMLFTFAIAHFAVSPPVILQNLKDVNIMLFGDAKFQCTAKGYNFNITWQKHDSTFPRSSKIYQERVDEDKIKSILEINDAVGFYAGKYCCIAKNEAGNDLSCAHLNLKGICFISTYHTTQ